ncbi:MAG: tryptophan synthase subunit alpha [Chloroflexi bacterium]|nr:tryptophan synthase subunit alpha [Chloroflexota bacterium]
MSRISSAFKKGRPAFIGYLTLGYPTLEMSLEAAAVLAESGCDILELGIPFSDPLADGTTIQRASQAALEGGITPRRCLEAAALLRGRANIPLLFMSYYNPILALGQKAFCAACREAGVNGFLMVDLPPEEGENLEAEAKNNGLDMVYLLAPTSTRERVRLVAQHSRGFIYLVSLTGVTGPREALPPELEQFVARVRPETSLPLCVGFGIAGPEQAKRVARVADGVVVGSRLVQLLEEPQPLEKLKSFALGLRKALDSIRG